MSFNIQRDGSNKPVFKSITNLNQNSLLNSLLDRNIAGSPEVNFTSITINNVVIDNTITTKLAPVSEITAGIAVANKALVLDSSRNITGINKIYCTQIYINNVLLDPSIFSGGAVSVSTQDAARSELTGITIGLSQENKAIVLNKNLKVSGVKELNVESAESGGQLLVNSKDNTFEATSIYMRQRINNIYAKNELNSYFSIGTNTGSIGDMGSNTLYESDYSPSLKIHVGAYSNSSLAYSYNGIDWKLGATFTSQVRFVAWFSEHNRFLGVGGNFLYESSNGINWTSTKISSTNLFCIAWSTDLQMYVIGCESRPNIYNVGFDLTKWYNSEGPFNVTTNRIIYVQSSKRFLACTLTGLNSLLSSNDGKIWTVLPITTQNQSSIRMFAYSPTMDIIVMPSGASAGRANRVGFYSKDGGFTLKPYYYNGIEFNVVKWIGDLGLFIGVSNATQQFAYSHDGINWKGFSVDNVSSNPIACITYDKPTRKVCMRTTSNGNTYVLIYNSLNNATANYFLNAGSNFLSLNTTQANGVLNLGNDSGNMVKISPTTRLDTGYINLVNGELKVIGGSLQISCRNLTTASGKKLNLSLLSKTNLYIENAYYFDLYGDNKKNCLIKYGSSKEITIGGYLCVSGLTIGGNSFTGGDNIAEFANCELGKATASRFLLATYGNTITGINKVSCKSTKINNYILTSKERTDNYTVEFKNKANFNLEKKNYGLFGNIYNSTPIINSNIYFGTSALSDRLFYIKEMDLLLGYKVSGNSLWYKNIRSNYNIPMNDSINTVNLIGTAVAVTRMVYIREFGNIYICTGGGLFYSKDGYSWDRVNMMTEQSSTVDSITYSPELELIVITNINNIMISKNGIDFKSTPHNTYTESLVNVIWVSSWGLFVGISRTQSATRAQYLYSYDGLFWDFLESNEENIIKSSTIPSNLAYSSKLDMLIAQSSNLLSYTYNGKIWYNITSFVGNGGTVSWIDELEVFIMSSTGLATAFFYYSYDGIEWITVKTPTSVNTTTYTGISNAWIYIKSTNSLINTISGGTAAVIILNNVNFLSNNYNVDSVVCEYNENLAIDIVNNRVGLAQANPQFSLELGEDLAFKPTSSTWSTSSDERLKENIVNADLNVCYDNVKNIPLKHYTWNDDVYTSNQIGDRSQLGWIAQDVEDIIPKAVERKNMHGLIDCRTLNNDQIIANLYGAVQKLIQMDENMEEYFV